LKRAKYKRRIKDDPNILDNKDITVNSFNNFPSEILKLLKKLIIFNKKVIDSLVKE